MSAGTLALTNGSTTVTGSSTAFQTDLAVNDFIVCKIGGTTYTLGVSTIGSNTALTLTQPFTGPTTTGVAWYAVPNQTLVGITTELAANLTTVYRSVLVNDANWTKVFSQSGNITVTLKDGSTFTGPSWNSIATTLNNKANTSDVLTKADNLASVADKAVARTNLGWVNDALPVSLGGTGGKTPQSALANLGYSLTRSSNNIVRKSKDTNGVDLYEMDFLLGATTAVGAFNPQTVGGITYYTHFYKFNLPSAMPNGILVALATLVGDRFGNQNPGYNADVKVSRDNDNGTGLLTSYITVSVKTPQTGWFPYFNFRVVGY